MRHWHLVEENIENVGSPGIELGTELVPGRDFFIHYFLCQLLFRLASQSASPSVLALLVSGWWPQSHLLQKGLLR
jgi:hypothetical protein